MPETTPSADSFASRGPDRISNADAADAFGLGDEVGAVGGVAAGGGGDRVDAADLHESGTRRENAAATVKRLGDGVRRQQAGGLNLAAEPAQRLLVEER